MSKVFKLLSAVAVVAGATYVMKKYGKQIETTIEELVEDFVANDFMQPKKENQSATNSRSKAKGGSAKKSSSEPANNNDRQEKISKLIKDLGQIVMQDVVKVFPNVSERTLRRDLQTLIEKNFIEKKGTTKSAVYKKV